MIQHPTRHTLFAPAVCRGLGRFPSVQCCWPLIMLGCLLLGSAPAAAALPPCAERPTQIDPPWVSAADWCLEEVLRDESGGELGFTALAAAPDGTLYAARPLSGEVYALTDGDGDGLPERARRLLSGLSLPNGLAFADGALFISGGPHLYRYQDGRLTTLVDDLPAGAGFWTGGVTLGSDGRLLVATGAECDFCLPANPERGAILSFAPDGTDRQLVASGLRQPVGLTFRRGVLWVGDTVRDGLADSADLDELNRVEPGAHFGWPFCIGPDNQPDLAGSFDCASASRPALMLPSQSTPVALAAYEDDALPAATGSLLMVLSGSHDRAVLNGYTLAMIHFDEAGQPLPPRIILPEVPAPERDTPLQKMHYQASGFWPHRPLGLAISPQGWIYISVGGGRILALRPRDDAASG